MKDKLLLYWLMYAGTLLIMTIAVCIIHYKYYIWQKIKREILIYLSFFILYLITSNNLYWLVSSLIPIILPTTVPDLKSSLSTFA